MSNQYNQQPTKSDDVLLAGFLFGCGLVIGGVVGALVADRSKKVDGNDVLQKAKALFTDPGTIEGSWIELQPIQAERFGQKQEVFYGGISRTEDNELVQYEFMADPSTGNFLDFYKL